MPGACDRESLPLEDQQMDCRCELMLKSSVDLIQGQERPRDFLHYIKDCLCLPSGIETVPVGHAIFVAVLVTLQHSFENPFGPFCCR